MKRPERSLSSVIMRDAPGRSALMAQQHAPSKDFRVLEAVKRRDQKALAALIRAKADVNAAQPDGATALAWAVHLGERSMAETLLGAGAKVNVVDEYGETPLTLAAANGDGEIVQRSAEGGCECARRAMERRDGADDRRQRRQRRRRAAARAPWRGRERRGAAPGPDGAHVGGCRRALRCRRALLEIGADPKAVSKSGFNALAFAVAENDVDVGAIAAGRRPRSELHPARRATSCS